MSHPSHRDHINAIQFKRLNEDLDDEEASRIADLLAADQQRNHDCPVYRELVKPMAGGGSAFQEQMQ